MRYCANDPRRHLTFVMRRCLIAGAAGAGTQAHRCRHHGDHQRAGTATRTARSRICAAQTNRPRRVARAGQHRPQVRGGELLALLGPNGASKTTAIGLLLGLVRRCRRRRVVQHGSATDRGAPYIRVMLQGRATGDLAVVGDPPGAASYYPAPRSWPERRNSAGTPTCSNGLRQTVRQPAAARAVRGWHCAGGPRLLFLDNHRRHGHQGAAEIVGGDPYLVARRQFGGAHHPLPGGGRSAGRPRLRDGARQDRQQKAAWTPARGSRSSAFACDCSTRLSLADVAAWPEVAGRASTAIACACPPRWKLLVRRLLAHGRATIPAGSARRQAARSHRNHPRRSHRPELQETA